MHAAHRSQEALDLLIQDHRELQRLFSRYALADDAGSREAIVRSACRALAIHTTIEEELLYPSVHVRIEDPDLVDEALTEHQSAGQLIAQLDALGPDDALFDATFKVLVERVGHHFSEEERSLFPEVRRTRVDQLTMAAAMVERRLQLHEALARETQAS